VDRIVVTGLLLDFPERDFGDSMPRTNDAGRDTLVQIRQCVLYLSGPPAEVATASAPIRLALIDLVCRIAHIRYDCVNAWAILRNEPPQYTS
jgi:hypothetical protein